MNVKLLNKLAKKRLALEKVIAKKDLQLEEIGTNYDTLNKEIRKLKLERMRLNIDVKLVMSEKEPKHSSEYRKKRVRKKNAK